MKKTHKKKKGGDAFALFAVICYLLCMMLFMIFKNTLEYQTSTVNWTVVFLRLSPTFLLGNFFLVLYLLYPRNPKKVSRFGMQSWVGLCILYALLYAYTAEQLVVIVFFCGVGLVFLSSTYIQALRLEGEETPF